METIPKVQDGLILLDKPSEMTSHDCVASVRKLCPGKTKVGHGGTLDPFCTGLLLILVGKCTRLASFFQGMGKAYEGIIRFGEGTDSFDRDGKVTATGPTPKLSAGEWQDLANGFVGSSLQIPPAFSAKRIGKVRAYELARRGETPKLAPQEITIYDFNVSPLTERDLHFRLHCSTGTYVRAIARDIGERAGSPAHCFQLCRTEVGAFSVQNTNKLDQPFEPRGFIPFDDVDLAIPILAINQREEKLVIFGRSIPSPRNLLGHDGAVKITGASGNFVALGRVEGREIKPFTVFSGARARK